MKRAFTLMELIVVMVILGVLISLALYSYKPKNLQHDIDYIYLKILEAKYQGINFDKRGLSKGNKIGCIELQEERLKELAKKEHYELKSAIKSFITTLCFDSFGRAHIDDTLTLPHSLLTKRKEILQLSYSDQSVIFEVLPQSGYIIKR